jgi:hypothetical protein
MSEDTTFSPIGARFAFCGLGFDFVFEKPFLA